jgi:hypothetical protein
MTSQESAFEEIKKLAQEFRANERFYLTPEYQESQARKDFIDKFLIALGWDVNHDTQKNPFEQEVKVERGVNVLGVQKRADYAFYLSPDFRDVRFFVEAKKPQGDIATPDNYFQTLRYGWNAQTPLAVLTNFAEFHVLDCRYKPDIKTVLQCAVKTYRYTDYDNAEKFAEIYYLFSRESVASGSLEKFADSLVKRRGKAVQKGAVPGVFKGIDDAFLEELDEHRHDLAHMFKDADSSLDGETLTEIAQRTLDRLVFTRFLEDRQIESEPVIPRFGQKGSAWDDFLAESRRLDGIYNGIVFKKHDILDSPNFKIKDGHFSTICEKLSHRNSPYDFNIIPIHILGSIYERFLGKVIMAGDKQVRVEEKPEVRKAGGVYYTPQYIVNYIVENTVGKMIEGKPPGKIAEMRFADISCGSGSFLLGMYDTLLTYHRRYYNSYRSKAKKDDCVERDGVLHLTLKKRREILLNNIYGVDVDAQAVEVAQLSLYLKLLEEETIGTTHEYQQEFHETLLPSLSKKPNIVCGNSLIGTDILSGENFAGAEERKLNPMDFEARFPEIMRNGGFDVIVGNPPYLYSAGQEYKEYFKSHYSFSEYQTDFYVFFIEKALKILRQKGQLGMIISDSWIKGKYFTRLREYLLINTQVRNIAVFDYPPFESAVIENSIIILEKSKPSDNLKIYKYTSPSELSEQNTLRVSDCLAQGLIDIYGSPESKKLIEHLEHATHPLSVLCRLNRGVHAYRTDGYGKSHFSSGPQTKRDKDEKSYHSQKRIDQTYFPEIKGKNLERYGYTSDGIFISYGDWLAEPRTPEFFFNPKLAIRKIIAPKLVCTFIKENVILDQSIYVAIRSEGQFIDLKFLLGILGSSIGGWYIRTKHGIYDTLYPWFTKEQLAQFPIPVLDCDSAIDKSKHNELVKLVDAMLETKRQSNESKTDKDKTYYESKFVALDRQIDELVYKLYGLTDDEIRIVEENTKSASDGKR